MNKARPKAFVVKLSTEERKWLKYISKELGCCETVAVTTF